jgi:anaphase-promoting complex subunit 1
LTSNASTSSAGPKLTSFTDAMLEAVLLGLDASPGLLAHARIPKDPSSSRNTFKLAAQAKSPTRVVSSVNNEAEEELVWSGQTVTWSRGCQIYRQYSFGHDKEDVAYAVFTHFQRGTNQVAGRFTKGKGKEEDTARLDQTFGPFHTAHTSRWGQSIPSNSVKGVRLERALMIFLQTKAYIYFPSGEDVIVHLPFIVEKAWPLSIGGVIVQRLLQKREIRRKKRQSGSVLRGMDVDIGSTSILDNLVELEDEGEDLPRVWALEKPLDEFKMVTETASGFSIPYSSELLLVGTEPGSPVVIYDTDRNQVVFYRRRYGSSSPQTVKSPLTARTMRPEDVMRQPEPLPKSGRASLGRNPSTTITRTDRRQSGIADPLERTTRRAPRLSRTAGPDKDLPAGSAAGELHATLDPPPFAVTVNQPARKGGRVVSGASSVGVDKSDRRGSGAFMREEVPVADKRGIFAIGEKDLRETTMMMGLERPAQTLKSDITLERITWDTPPA